MRPVFGRYLELEATRDGTPEFSAAGKEMDQLWDSLTDAEKLYIESGHASLMPGSEPDLPTHDMDGCYYEGDQPSDEDMARYAAEQEQAAEWAKQGKCQSCGDEKPLSTGYCGKCMENWYACYADSQVK